MAAGTFLLRRELLVDHGWNDIDLRINFDDIKIFKYF